MGTVSLRPSMLRLTAVLLFALVGVATARMFILDDGVFPEPLGHHRARRDTGPYGPPAPAYHAPKHHGKVGPVYTFVKTDPQANFKWGVRHRAGVQYGR